MNNKTTIVDRERVTVPDAAQRTSYSPDVIYRAYHRGEIEGEQRGRTIRLYLDSLERWLRSQ